MMESVLLFRFSSLLRKIQKGKDYATILDELETDDENYSEELWSLVQEHPKYTVEELLDVYLERQCHLT